MVAQLLEFWHLRGLESPTGQDVPLVGGVEVAKVVFEHAPRGVEVLIAISIRVLQKQPNKEDRDGTDRGLRSSLD